MLPHIPIINGLSDFVNRFGKLLSIMACPGAAQRLFLARLGPKGQALSSGFFGPAWAEGAGAAPHSTMATASSQKTGA